MVVTGNTLRICIIGFVCAVLVLGTPVWAIGQKISTEPGTHITPRIDGEFIVWADVDDNTGIYLYDICSRKLQKISSSQSSEANLPQVSGETVVWGDTRDTLQGLPQGLVRYDIASGRETPLPHNTFGSEARPAIQEKPAISGNIIAFWTENPWGEHGTHEIYMYDLGLNVVSKWFPSPIRRQFKQISPSVNFEYKERPRISGDKIVWADDRNVPNQKFDIWLYDLSTNTETQVSTSSSTSNRNPDISGTRVVWEEEESPGSDANIVLYDIPTHSFTHVTNDQADQRNPAISGNNIVWDDNRNYQTDGWDIYRYDINRGVESRITSDPNDQRYPDVDGYHIVWQDPRGVYLNRGGFFYDFADQVWCNLHTLPRIIPGLQM